MSSNEEKKRRYFNWSSPGLLEIPKCTVRTNNQSTQEGLVLTVEPASEISNL